MNRETELKTETETMAEPKTETETVTDTKAETEIEKGRDRD